ncbi:MAG: hypothetical protein R2748_08475 [Bryobacterales bacterium]
MAAAIAATLVMGLWLSGGRTPERYEAPPMRVTAPTPHAVEADWTPPMLRAPGVRLSMPTTQPPLPPDPPRSSASQPPRNPRGRRFRWPRSAA